LLLNAASEEVDHLAWCNQRLTELGSRPSLLNPVWYAGSFALGVLASYAGVPRNLGFMAETEKQVEAHLEEHLRTLPVQDERSRQIVQKMKEDEAQHRASAEAAGGVPLPGPVKAAMRAMSKVMTTTAYWV
jgi:ubiquinone biosynthesis monooxygenase Coq7